LPEGRTNDHSLPPQQKGPAAWLGPEMAARPESWTWRLSPAEVAEVEGAAEAALAAGGGRPSILEPEEFPLPRLGAKLTALRGELLSGRGFSLIKGLPAADWPLEKAAAAFLGLGAWIGVPRSQNAKGHLLGHVADLGLASSDPNVRIYQTHERQSFHTDSCDVVGLLCLKQARAGGESQLVSALTLWNEMLARRPDLAPELLRPVAIDRRGEVPAGAKPWFEIAPLSWHAGQLTVHYQRQYIDSAQRFEEAPRLSDRQREALDLFDALTDDPALNFSMRLEPGDMQFVYNHVLLHDRAAFTDWPEPERRRHLLRLWLAAPGDRPLPEAFAARFGSVEIGARGGIEVPGSRLTVPLEP
jgi:hypothetical protein